MESKITPGNWYNVGNEVRSQTLEEAQKGFYTLVCQGSHHPDKKKEAQDNAKLLATAPEMLKALKELCKEIEFSCAIGSDPMLLELCKKHLQAIQVIQKATL